MSFPRFCIAALTFLALLIGLAVYFFSGNALDGTYHQSRNLSGGGTAKMVVHDGKADLWVTQGPQSQHVDGQVVETQGGFDLRLSAPLAGYTVLRFNSKSGLLYCIDCLKLSEMYHQPLQAATEMVKQ